MLNVQAQSPFADALVSILRAQLRAASDALAVSVQGWSMWTQMLTRPAIDEQPMAARSQWPHPRFAGSMGGSMPGSMSGSMSGSMFGPMLWSLSWPIKQPLPGLWQWGTCDVARWGFVPFAPIWWTALGRGCWAPSANALPSAVHAGPRPGRGCNAGRDASFASYRSAGGHALAPVIVKPTEELAQATARAWLSPLEAVLGLWRAALGG